MPGSRLRPATPGSRVRPAAADVRVSPAAAVAVRAAWTDGVADAAAGTARATAGASRADIHSRRMADLRSTGPYSQSGSESHSQAEAVFVAPR